MSGSPFGAPDMLDLWWRTLLQNRERLEELASSMRGIGDPTPAAGVSHDDLAAVVDALTLVERRLDALDEQVETLAEGMAQLVRHVQQQPQGNGDREA